MTVRVVAEMGHDVQDVRGTGDEGMSDRELWTLAQSQGRLLITTDKGFASRRHEPHYGLPVVRLRRLSRQRIHEPVLSAVARLGSIEWAGRPVIVRDTALSIWPPNVWTE